PSRRLWEVSKLVRADLSIAHHNPTERFFSHQTMGFLNGSPLNFRNAARFARWEVARLRARHYSDTGIFDKVSSSGVV
ncbi:hypothetical protein COS61_00560, partial [Candidatus Wolfebacteria bacterium CG03_land_8_20_14_0_80_40_12]